MRNFKRKSLLLLFILVLGIVFLKIFKTPSPGVQSCKVPSVVIVTKVIDGDTVIVEGGYSVRLLGIDTDERGEPCYEEAKEYLEDLVLGREVRLERDEEDVDKYGRCLRYIFVDGKNVNLELVRKGLAVARFYLPNVKYHKEITNAEEMAIKEKIGCKWRRKD